MAWKIAAREATCLKSSKILADFWSHCLEEKSLTGIDEKCTVLERKICEQKGTEK